MRDHDSNIKVGSEENRVVLLRRQACTHREKNSRFHLLSIVPFRNMRFVSEFR